MPLPPKLRRSFFDRPVLEVAPELIGATLLVNGVGGRIVEVEAYHHTDPAAHSYRGPTERNAVMFGPARLRLCLPLLRHPLVPQLRLRGGRQRQRGADPGAGADWRELLQCGEGAAWPTSGRCARGRANCARRSASRHRHNGLALDRRAVRIARARRKRRRSSSAPRIGITKAVEHPWRFGLKGSRFLSKPFKV